MRSRLHFNRGRDLWGSLAKRLDGSERPKAELVDGSDSEESLRARLGLTADVPGSESWGDRNPRVRAELGIAQPGLAKSQPIAAARNGKAAPFLQLLSVAIDAAEFVGGEPVVRKTGLDEALVLRASAAFEAAAPWRDRWPPILAD